MNKTNKTIEDHINRFNRAPKVVDLASEDPRALLNIPGIGMTGQGLLAYANEKGQAELITGEETFGFAPELTGSERFERLQGILKGEGKGLWKYQDRLDAAADEITRLSGSGLDDQELFYLDGLTAHVTELMSRKVQRRNPRALLSTEKLDAAIQAQYAPAPEAPPVLRMVRDSPRVVRTVMAATAAAFAGGIAIGVADQMMKNHGIHDLGDLVTRIGNIDIGSSSMLYAGELPQHDNDKAKASWEKAKANQESAKAAAKTAKKQGSQQKGKEKKTVDKDEKTGFFGYLINKMTNMFSGDKKHQESKEKAISPYNSRLLYNQNAPQMMGRNPIIPRLNVVIYNANNFVIKTFNQMKEGDAFNIQYGNSFGLDRKIVYKDKDGKERSLDCLIQALDENGNRTWYLTNKNWKPKIGVGPRAFDLDRINTAEAGIVPGDYAVIFTNEGRIQIIKAEDAKKNPIYQSTLMYMTVDGEPVANDRPAPANHGKDHGKVKSDKPKTGNRAQTPAVAKEPSKAKMPAEPATEKSFQLIGSAWYLQGDETFALAKKADPQNTFRSSMVEGILRTENFQAWANRFGISYDVQQPGFGSTILTRNYGQFQIGGQLRVAKIFLLEGVYMNGSNTWSSESDRELAMTGVEESFYRGFFYRGGLFIPLTKGDHGFLSKGFVTATIGAGSGNQETTYSDTWVQNATVKSRATRDGLAWHGMALADLGLVAKPLDGIVAEIGASGSKYHSTDGEVTDGKRFSIGGKLMIPVSKLLPGKIAPSWTKNISITPIIMYSEKNDSQFAKKYSNTVYGIGVTIKTK